MHVPDGFISGPISLAGYALSAAVAGVAFARARKDPEESLPPLLGVTAAFVFAAQMINFPVALGTSGHFLGAVLAAVLLGPWNACIVLSLVVGLQCLLFADGGLTALGINVFNMGVVGVFFGYGVFWILGRLLRGRAGFMIAAAVAAWASVLAASSACALELGFSGTVPLRYVLPAMGGVHALIGIGEAVITATSLSVVLAARPDIVTAWRPRRALPEAAQS